MRLTHAAINTWLFVPPRVDTRQCSRLVLGSQSLSSLLEIAEWDQEHTKAFSVFFAQMLVMHLVRLANGYEIRVVCSFEPPDALVDENLVNNEVGDPIDQDAQANPQPRCMQALYAPNDEQGH